jgi:hypothetical protein
MTAFQEASSPEMDGVSLVGMWVTCPLHRNTIHFGIYEYHVTKEFSFS